MKKAMGLTAAAIDCVNICGPTATKDSSKCTLCAISHKRPKDGLKSGQKQALCEAAFQAAGYYDGGYAHLLTRFTSNPGWDCAEYKREWPARRHLSLIHI